MSDVDDSSIEDNHWLLRRIHPDHIVPDGNTGGTRVSSAAFRDPSMSVDVEEMLIAGGKTWSFSLQGYPTYSLMKLLTAVARSHQQSVVHCPVPENDAHAEVRGKKPGSVSRALRDAAQWVHKQ